MCKKGSHGLNVNDFPVELLNAIASHCTAHTLAFLSGAAHCCRAAALASAAERLEAASLPSLPRSSMLLHAHLMEGRERASNALATCKRSVAPDADPPSFIVAHTEHGICLAGATHCSASLQPHVHVLRGRWGSASFCARYGVLVDADMRTVSLVRDASSGILSRPSLVLDEVPDGGSDVAARMVPVGCHGVRGGCASGETECSLSELKLPLPPGETIARVVACPRHVLLHGSSGSVYTLRMQYGLPLSSPRCMWQPSSPTKRVACLSSLFHHVLFCCADGTAYSLGDAADGKLGYEPAGAGFVAEPRAIESVASRFVCSVAAGGGHSLLLTADGACLSFGAHHLGQLGRPLRGAAPGSNALPQEVPLPRATPPLIAVAAGDAHSVTLTCHGRCLTWGCNSHGQLGRPLGDTARDVIEFDSVASPVKALEGVHVHAISATTALSLFEAAQVGATNMGRWPCRRCADGYTQTASQYGDLRRGGACAGRSAEEPAAGEIEDGVAEGEAYTEEMAPDAAYDVWVGGNVTAGVSFCPLHDEAKGMARQCPNVHVLAGSLAWHGPGRWRRRDLF